MNGASDINKPGWMYCVPSDVSDVRLQEKHKCVFKSPHCISIISSLFHHPQVSFIRLAAQMYLHVMPIKQVEIEKSMVHAPSILRNKPSYQSKLLKANRKRFL